LDKGKISLYFKLRYFDDVQTDFRILGIERIMHKDQHGDKNGRESQGRLGSKPKDRNVIDKGYFYHCVLKNAEIPRSGWARSVDKPIAAALSPNIRWRWVVSFKGRESYLRDQSQRYWVGHKEGLGTLKKEEASCSWSELNQNIPVVQPAYILKHPGFRINVLWVNRPLTVLVLLRYKWISLSKCTVFTNFLEGMHCLKSQRKRFVKTN
jgi:hypothetical protein